MKRDKVDNLFSKMIRERDNWTCQCCHKQYPEGHRQGLHCSHIYSRRHTLTRHDPMNAVAHCYSCHQRLGGDPVEFTAWALDYFGTGHMEILRDKVFQDKRKVTKAEKAEQYDHLKEEYKRMMQERANGAETVNFVGFF